LYDRTKLLQCFGKCEIYVVEICLLFIVIYFYNTTVPITLHLIRDLNRDNQ